MIKKQSRQKVREKRHKRIRLKISGTAEKPRLCVFRSNKHIYAQIIDDTLQSTLASASTKESAIAVDLKSTSNKEAAAKVGTAIAKKALEKGINQVVFDRGGYIFHGKIKALADASREAGLQF